MRLWLTGLAVLPLVASSTCEEDDRPRSIIDQFKIIAIRVTPPSIELNGNLQVSVSALLVDPLEAGDPIEYAILPCTNFQGVVGCLEEAAVMDIKDANDIEEGTLSLTEEDYQEFFSRYLVRGSVETPSRIMELNGTFAVSSNLEYFLDYSELESVETLVYVLACRRGTCPAIDEMDAYLAGDPNGPTGEELLYTMSIPEELTAGTGIENVTLARKEYEITTRLDSDPFDGDERNENPQVDFFEALSCFGAPESYGKCTLEAGLTTDSFQSYLTSPEGGFYMTEMSTLRFYSTAGEIYPPAISVYGPSTVSTEISWDDALEPPVDLFVVVQDARGGLNYSFLEDGIPPGE